MDTKVEEFYQSIFTDLTVDQEEAQELAEYFDSLNPPPDKLVWLRASAFRIGCGFLSDDHDKNVSVLRTINAIVHSLERTCMLPKLPEGNSEFDGDAAESFYKGLFEDLSIEQEENGDLYSFFKENTPPAASLVALRATAFKAGVEFLTDDNEQNIALLRCINVVIHAFESTCLLPKDYSLKLPPDFDLDVSLNDAIQQLWNLDVNRLRPNVDYEINVQDGKKPYWKSDQADDPLFTSVDKNALKRPTYKAFIALLDNYKAETGEGEQVSNQEKQEIWSFLKAIMQTAPMQFCHKYLVAKGADNVPESQSDFMKLLYKIWFDLYYRERGDGKDSSGFEHVFVGEVKNGQVSGFHNWIQFYYEEQKGHLDYRGYIKPRSNSEAEANSDDHVLTLQFSWNGVEKFVGTSFIGVSPEFEFAVYTLCFLLGEEQNDVVLNTGTDEFQLNIRCYKIAGSRIGTSFPEATAHYD
eukprot:Nitzschia sp. Nitz4//scaffold166_size90379//56059//57597//NITZ4_005063-RA/size90379-augustus-gene-0.15-mRNA-1//-1//CDS//3329538214//8480//frame0